MILNIYEIKSEALLFFCNEIIQNYKNSDKIIDFDIPQDTKEYIYNEIKQIQKSMQLIIHDKNYYLQNQKVIRIKYIVKNVIFLEKELSKMLKKNEYSKY